MTGQTSDTETYVQQLSRSWWLLVVRGFLLTILGVYALLNPTTDTTLITVLVGVYLLVDGVLVTVLGFFGRKTTPNTRTTFIRGLLGFTRDHARPARYRRTNNSANDRDLHCGWRIDACRSV
jgi:uncharacterized membrane protein HdeD (DUF308 family)